jgi:hypothetical protein
VLFTHGQELVSDADGPHESIKPLPQGLVFLQAAQVYRPTKTARERLVSIYPLTSV